MNEVSHIYNNLFRYESKVKSSSYPIHKRLNFEDNRTLLDFILDKVQINEGEYVLDAGCGTGHTLFYLNQKYDIFGTGISISKNEVEFACNEAARLISDGNLRFQLMSYDEQLPGSYDKIFCIESLKHSVNLKSTIHGLLDSLLKNGTLIIADDFLLEDTTDTNRHKQLWQAPGFGSLHQLKEIIHDLGQFHIDEYELTEQVPIRSPLQSILANSMASIAVCFTNNGLKRNLITYKGALLLEKLYKNKLAAYWILIIKKR